MPTLYLAASWDARDKVRGIRNWLIAEYGYRVEARWLDQQEPGLDVETIAQDPELAATCANTDIGDILKCDTFVVFTEEPSSTGGYHTEFGIALALGKHIVIVGPRCNIFQTIVGIDWVEDLAAFTKFVRRINAASKTRSTQPDSA